MKVYLISSAKMEELYIEDWVNYYLNLGIDKIIINDNNDKDYPYQLKDILKQYIDNGQVIVERYYDTHKLEKETSEKELKFILTWLYNKYKDSCEWMLKMDIDEYLEIPETNNDIRNFLLQDKFNNIDCIVLPWKLYKVKKEYLKYYNRLSNNERFEVKTPEKHKYCKHKQCFKYIIKCPNIIECSTHLPSNIYVEKDNQIIYYDINKIVFPDGQHINESFYGNKNDTENTKDNIIYKEYLYKLYNIAFINHYRYKSDEEFFMQFDKLELYNHPSLGNQYIKNKKLYEDLCLKYPEWADKQNRRDLYKIYFIDNK